MNLRSSNQLTMVGACLTIAQTAENQAVWDGKDPTDFATDLAQLATNYGEVTAKSALADGATGGAADAKAVAEGALENAAYVLARALANHSKKTGDLDRLAKVDVNRTAIVQLRNQKLVTKATDIRDLGAAAQTEPGAAGRGVTAARVATLTAAIGAFQKVMNAPRGQIVNRGTLLKEVETDVARLLEQVRDLDDLVLQFDGTDAGLRFNEAWKRARIIIDTGGGHGNGDGATPSAPNTPPNPPVTT